MRIRTQRAALIKQLRKVEDPSLLRAIKVLLLYGMVTNDHISIEQYNRELDEARAAINRGEFTTHEDLIKQMKKW